MSNTFPRLVQNELIHAKEKFPEPTSMPKNWTRPMLAHYWQSVINEEFREFQEGVFTCEFTQEHIIGLVQLAAMCQRAAESLELCDNEMEITAYVSVVVALKHSGEFCIYGVFMSEEAADEVVALITSGEGYVCKVTLPLIDGHVAIVDDIISHAYLFSEEISS